MKLTTKIIVPVLLIVLITLLLLFIYNLKNRAKIEVQEPFLSTISVPIPIPMPTILTPMRPLLRRARQQFEHYDKKYGPNDMTREIKKWMIFG